MDWATPLALVNPSKIELSFPCKQRVERGVNPRPRKGFDNIMFGSKGYSCFKLCSIAEGRYHHDL